jgi:DNA-binding transcriptional regulator YiaG
MTIKRLSNVNGKATNVRKPYTPGSISFIRRKAKSLSVVAIANILHRSVRSVRNVAAKNNIQLA